MTSTLPAGAIVVTAEYLHRLLRDAAKAGAQEAMRISSEKTKPEFFNQKQAAAYLRVSVPTLTKRFGRMRSYPRSLLDERN